MLLDSSSSPPPPRKNHHHFHLSESTAAAEIAAYRAEYEDERTWEALQEDERGMLMPLGAARRRGGGVGASSSAAAAAAPPRAAPSLLLPAGRAVRRGVIRSLVIVVDLSAAAAAPDMRPTRAAAAASAVGALVRAFFDANQLSSVSLVATRHGRAERLTELSGSPEAHIAKLAASLECGGAASLQNALDVAVETLRTVPPYSLRECLVFFCGLASCDPGDVFASVQAAKRARVRVSVVGLAAEVFACSKAAAMTKGRHAVALDAAHATELALQHAPAPAITGEDATPSLVEMGFARDLSGSGVGGTKGPQAFVGASATLARDSATGEGGHRRHQFECPRCLARVAELPAACHVCGLTLVSSPHLARSYHHLFPVREFEEAVVGEEEENEKARCCFGCLSPLWAKREAGGSGGENGGGNNNNSAAAASRCPACLELFCLPCDALIHVTMHVCPGCEAAVAAEGRG